VVRQARDGAANMVDLPDLSNRLWGASVPMRLVVTGLLSITAMVSLSTRLRWLGRSWSAE